MRLLARYRATQLHRQAQARSEEGNNDAALALYAECLALDPNRSTSLYNVGLIYKYRGDWEKSFEFNSRAYALSPSDEASRWNLAIAATALRRWSVARKAWKDNGLDVSEGDAPINMNLGVTPVRLNPDDAGEVVWGRRIDPVRVVVESVPFPESGFRSRDVVLHDGAPVGFRNVEGRQYPVFNVLELFEPSNFSTYVARVRISTQDQMKQLAQLADAAGVVMEDWTGSVRQLCKQCSEGTPHETHDQNGEKTWNTARRVGLACSDPDRIEEIVAACESRRLLDFEEVTLELSA
ncbi:MAG TPA: tetratricopeptide repeat protein [Terriglobia bacterium]|nr:tetratricopeptide repeat protein [Terriglobia bacterium]